MIKAELLKDAGILLISPQGKLAASDFAILSKIVDPYIVENKNLNGLMIEAKEFPGWSDFAALVSHIRFVKNHHSVIEKVAVVSDDTFLSKAPAVAKHFIKAQIQHFDPSQRDAAMVWLGATTAKKAPEPGL